MKHLVSVAAILASFLAVGKVALAQEDPGPDIIAVFDPAVSMGDLTIGTESTDLAVVPGSSVLINTSDASCTGVGCRADLVYLRVGFERFETDIVSGGDVIGHLTFDNATVTIGGPVPMTNGGFGFVIPGGTQTSFTAVISGNIRGRVITNAPAGSLGATAGPVLLSFSVQPFQALSINGTIPFLLTSTGSIDGDPVEFTLPGELAIAGASGTANSPFRNSPPNAVANVPANATCGQSIALDGSGSSDPQGPADLVGFHWFSDGSSIAATQNASVTLAPGTHTVVLQVVDSRGASDTDQKQVVVAGEVPPTFTFVPPDVNAPACGMISLGPAATAQSSCGLAVQVTNDAPAFFPAGVTTVTWTARSVSGLTSTATQRVTAPLNGNPDCCPSGSHRILGTSNNDNLIGTDGPDCIFGFGAQDTIDGRGGNDLISGGEGDDRIVGGDGNDLIEGNNGQDQLAGGNGNDRLLGGNGDDRLDGGAGDDWLDGGAHQNQCTGGPGADRIFSCTLLDASDQQPSGGAFNVCTCRPVKCTDCSSQVATCSSVNGCSGIIQCVRDTANCNLPHECSSVCESGATQAAITAARNLASCFGGCE